MEWYWNNEQDQNIDLVLNFKYLTDIAQHHILRLDQYCINIFGLRPHNDIEPIIMTNIGYVLKVEYRANIV